MSGAANERVMEAPTAFLAMNALWHIYRSSPLPQRLLAALRPWICPLQPILQHVPTGAAVLDIGCGNGLFLASVSRFRGLTRGIGIDVNPTAIAAARTVAQGCAYPLEFHCLSAMEDWPDERVDVVSMIDVIHHVPRALRRKFVLAALARVEEDGCLLYKDMCSSPAWRVAWNTLHDLILARERVHVEHIANVIEWASSAGFEPVIRDDYSACGLYGHELMVMRRRKRSLEAIDGATLKHLSSASMHV